MKSITIIIACCILILASSLKAQEVTPTKTLNPKTDTLPKKVKEFGLGFTSLFSTSYSLQYRWGNTKRLFRVNGTIGGFTAFGKSTDSIASAPNATSNFTNTSSGPTKTPLSLNVGLSFSMLYLKSIVKKFGIIYGPMVGVTLSTVSTQTTTTGTSSNYYYNNPNSPTQTIFPYSATINTHTESIQPYVGFVVGAFYKINRSFFLYAEITPNVYYTRANTISNITNFNSNNSPPNLQPALYNTQTNNSSSSNNTFGIASLSNSLATLTIVYRITGK